IHQEAFVSSDNLSAVVRRIQSSTLLLVAILVVALGLRLYNVRWDEGSLAHPDERSTVAFYAPTIHWPKDWSTALDPKQSPLNPLWDRQAQHRRSYTYGHFPLYLLVFSANVVHRLAPLAAKLGASPETVDLLRTANGVPGFAFVGRFLMALADTATVYLVYLIARRLYGQKAALLAAAFSAFTVLQIQLAHFFAVDPISTTFTLLVLYGAIRIVDEGSAWSAVLTGVGAALAIASKFSALPILAAPVVAVAVRWWRVNRTTDGPVDEAAVSAEAIRVIKLLLITFLVAIVVFLVTSPFVVLDWPNFRQAVIEEQGAMVRGEADFPFTRQYRGTTPYLYFIEQQVRWGMGWPLGLVAFGGLAWALVRTLLGKAKPGELIILSWIVPYFGITGLFLAKFMRYMVPVDPLCVLLGAGMLWTWMAWGMGHGESGIGNRESEGEEVGERESQGNEELAVVPEEPQRRLPGWVPGLVRWSALAAMVIALTGAVVWSLAFVNGVYGREEPQKDAAGQRVQGSYGHTHPWIVASRWIYDNVPDGSVIAVEHWDDSLPKPLPEPNANLGAHRYQQVTLPLYEEDTEQKYLTIKVALRQADYIMLASNRLYRSIPRLSERYPMTTKYYELLFAGKLGFEKVTEFTARPRLFGFEFMDDDADESFTVYDHPKPIIFKKVRELSDGEWDQLLGGSWKGAIPGYVGKPTLLTRLWGKGSRASAPPRAEKGKSLLLDVPVDELPDVGRYDWNRAASRSSLLAVLVWWLVVALLGWITWPLAFVLFPNLRDNGYILSRTLGWLAVGWIAWILVSLRLLTYTLTTLLLAVLLLILVSAYLFWRRRDDVVAFVRAQSQLILMEEALFGLAFLAFVLIRMLNPDLWQPWQGGEKFMEFAFLNAILRSPYFPPYDPYYAGGYINYYYYGHYLVSVLIKLTGIKSSVAFNLAVPTLFALTVTNAFSLVYSLAVRQPKLGEEAAVLESGAERGSSFWRRGTGTGLSGSLFVAVLGNLDGMGQVMRQLASLSGSNFRSQIPGLQTLVQASAGFWKVVTTEAHLPVYNYWEPSRVIPHSINEFPYWSYLFADLHPHMIGIPFTILFLALVLNLLAGYGGALAAGGPLEELMGLFAFPLVLGALGAINTWDVPTYFGIALLAFLVREWRGWRRVRLLPALVFALLLGGLAYLLYLPFFTHYHPVASSGVGKVRDKTELGKWLLIWGFFFFVAATYVLVELRRRGTRLGLLRWTRLLLDRWDQMPRFFQLHRLLVRRASPGYLLARWALAFALLLSILLALLDYNVPALLLLPLVGAGLLLLRRDVSAESLFTSALIFTGLLVLLGVEFVFLKDFLQGGEYYRMNTLFKFYIQVWVLLGLGSAAALPRIWAGIQRWRSPGTMVLWSGAFVVLLASSLVFPLMGTPQRVKDRFPGARPPIGTLDGMAFMTVGTYTWPDASNRIELRYDYEAINWLLEHVHGTPVIAEGRIDYYREGGMRVSSFTGLPTFLGAHQNEQRYGWQVGERDGIAREFFSTSDINRARQIIRDLHISYIYIGKLERTVYPPDGIAKFDRMADMGLLEVVFRNQEVTIYRVKPQT
ncbi:MAG TPA: hypothetical protein EYH31_03240, partial [Anaerolineae bacterium]|nr:hypothetical protein [Anaerolineae bacterium]